MKVDDLIVKVTAENTLIGSVATLLGLIKGELDAAIANGVDPTKLQTLSDLVDGGAKQLSDALAANTPVAPTV